jgi:tetratricopeptide (TPR) repeat protein
MSRKSPAEMNAILGSLRKEYQRFYVDRDFENALSVVRQALEIWPGPEILKDEALCLLRLNRSQEAYAIGKSLPAEELGVSYLDLMAEVCGHLGQTEEAVRYGNLALRGKDEEVVDRTKFSIPGGPPPVSGEGQNVVSFRLACSAGARAIAKERS